MTELVIQPDPAIQDPQNTPTPTPEVTPTPTPVAEVTPPEATPPKKTWWQSRIDELTREKHDAMREVNELRAAQSASPTPVETPPPVAVTMAEEEINRRAIALAEANTFVAKCNAVADKGKVEIQDWDNVTETFRSLGGLTPSLVEATLAAGEQEAHKLIADLAKNPDEAMRVLRMSPIQQAAEMVRRHTKIAAPAPISSAPAPITPVGGGNALAVKSLDDPNITTAEWIALREAQLAKKKVA